MCILREWKPIEAVCTDGKTKAVAAEGGQFFSGIRISLACNRIESFFCLLKLDFGCFSDRGDLGVRRRCER